MKTWKIDKNDTNDRVIEILKKYTTSLSDASDSILKGSIETELNNNKIYYYFYINGKINRYKLFSIGLIDLNYIISFTVNYFNSETTDTINVDDLEEKIDNIIQGEKIGSLLNYLIEIEKRILLK